MYEKTTKLLIQKLVNEVCKQATNHFVVSKGQVFRTPHEGL